MSRIYEIDQLTDQYKDNNFKDREITAFETKYPEARIIREKYNSERELEDDWQKYCELPYHLKVLCNERCLRLFGCKNEQQYIRLKAEFAKRDIPNKIKQQYIPMGFREAVEDELLIKRAKDYMDSGGYSILLIDYDNLADLNTDWYNFNNQCYDHKVIANNKSLEIYGKTVPEVYQREVKKFLVRDINNSSLDDLMTRPVITDSLAATEAVLDQINWTLDPVEAIMLLELAKKQISSPVENSLVSLVQENTQAFIMETKNYKEDYLGRYNYLLPWEIMGLFEDADELYRDAMFMNYYARGIGLKPPMKAFQEVVRQRLVNEDIENLIIIGWNPVLDQTNEQHHYLASQRANDTLREYCKYWFLNLEHTPNLLIEETSTDFHKGVSVIVIQELDKDHEDKVEDVPKVLVTLDYRTKYWNPIIYGEISSTEQSIDEVISRFKLPAVTCYFLKLSDGLYNRLKDINIEEFNDNNEIKRICSIIHMQTPAIANKKLFTTYLLSSIMHSHYGDDVFPLRFDHDSPKEMIVTLYSKLFGNYREIEQSYSKLNIFNDKGAHIQETFFFKDLILEASYKEEDESYIGITDLSKENKFTETWQDFQHLLNIQPNI